MKTLRTFVSGVLAGACIALGGTVFLLTESRLAGALLFTVGLFTICTCGFEHCVANMYYFTAAGVWSLRTLGYLLLMTAGNAVGGVLLPLARGWLEKGQ